MSSPYPSFSASAVQSQSPYNLDLINLIRSELQIPLLCVYRLWPQVKVVHLKGMVEIVPKRLNKARICTISIYVYV